MTQFRGEMTAIKHLALPSTTPGSWPWGVHCGVPCKWRKMRTWHGCWSKRELIPTNEMPRAFACAGWEICGFRERVDDSSMVKLSGGSWSHCFSPADFGVHPATHWIVNLDVPAKFCLWGSSSGVCFWRFHTCNIKISSNNQQSATITKNHERMPCCTLEKWPTSTCDGCGVKKKTSTQRLPPFREVIQEMGNQLFVHQSSCCWFYIHCRLFQGWTIWAIVEQLLLAYFTSTNEAIWNGMRWTFDPSSSELCLLQQAWH